MVQLLQQGRNKDDAKNIFYIDDKNQEQYMSLSGEQQDQHIKELTKRTDILLNDLIQTPIEDTISERWQYVKNSYKQNIKGLSVIEQYLRHQFAYTINKGEKVRLCLCDDKGEINIDINMYVLIHELTHIYDKRYLTTPEKHDEYFWILFSKIVKRALNLNLLSISVFSKDQKRCNTDILRASDINQIERYCIKLLPKV